MFHVPINALVYSPLVISFWFLKHNIIVVGKSSHSNPTLWTLVPKKMEKLFVIYHILSLFFRYVGMYIFKTLSVSSLNSGK
jgi:hypothetical protein